jgi:hypothetical protein
MKLEYAGMNRLGLDGRFELAPGDPAIPDAQIWGHPDRINEWIAQVEATADFRALRERDLVELVALQEDI